MLGEMDYKNHLEHFSLRWNNYNDIMKSGFHDLLRREDFVDVTIAAEGKLIQAHKMVLSICSPYFKNIFKANPCQHPVVFLKDVTYKELYGILQFMYLGEVSVQQEELGRFLKTAEALQIKGLTGEDQEKEEKEESLKNSNIRDQKEHAKFSNVSKYNAKLLQINLPEKSDAKRIKICSTPNGVSNDHNELLHEEEEEEEEEEEDEEEKKQKELDNTNEKYESQECIILPKEEPPELDFNDIECESISFKEESNRISDSQFQDNTSEMSDDVVSLPSGGNNAGLGHEFLNNIQIVKEASKTTDINQGPRSSPVLTKNQGKCPICGRILQHKKNLQTHISDQHFGVFRCWPCQICHKICKTWSALRVHTNRHHAKIDSQGEIIPMLGVTQQ